MGIFYVQSNILINIGAIKKTNSRCIYVYTDLISTPTLFPLHFTLKKRENRKQWDFAPNFYLFKYIDRDT